MSVNEKLKNLTDPESPLPFIPFPVLYSAIRFLNSLSTELRRSCSNCNSILFVWSSP